MKQSSGLPGRSAYSTIVLVGILSVVLSACTDNSAAPLVKGEKTTSSNDAKAVIVNPTVKYGVEGFYTGLFRAAEEKGFSSDVDNLITISIDSMNDKQVFGHSIIAGNDRPFTGTYTKAGNDYNVQANEPGDDKHDGKFIFTINTTDKKINGRWKSNDPKSNVTEREYELTPRTYKYSADNDLPDDVVGYMFEDTYKEEKNQAEALTEDAIKFNASKQLLKSRDVENMYAADLEAMRNAIYARHGYSFKNRRMRNLFDTYVQWYMPVTTDVTAMLTEVEQKNILLLKRYEKHAGKYYGDYGR